MGKLKELIGFIKNVAGDSRIPDGDKQKLLILLALVISPFDLIPDWIPIIGWMDDFVIIAIVLDYLFNHLDEAVLLSHYPWGMKSYVKIKKTARLVAMFSPGWIKDRIWDYKPSVY